MDHPRAGALGRASDAHLTRLVGGGDHTAFAVLYARHRAVVDAVARSSSPERAEDIAQEAWASAYRALRSRDAEIDPAGPWLATIARNVARDRHRREARRPEVASDEIVAAAPAPSGVESALEDKHSVGRLLGAFDELPEEQRHILHLREFGELTYKQIAERLGKPESTIEAALFRARRKMAKEYSELDSGRRCRAVQAQLATATQLSHRERRRVMRHLGRCASCERVARLEGAEHLIPAPRLARIAGTIPVPGAVARVWASGADAVAPSAGKIAVAAVAIVAGASALVVADRDGGAPPPRKPAPAEAAAAAPASFEATAILAPAPNVIRSHRVAAAERERNRPATPSAPVPASPAASREPASREPAARAPAIEPTRTPVPRRRTARAPERRAPAPEARAPASPAPQPAASAPAPAAPAAPAPQPTPPPPSPAPATPAAPAPQPSSGPRVTQTPTCLTPDCRIDP